MRCDLRNSFSHVERFQALTDHLKRFECIWRESPFYGVPLAWQEQYPALASALLHLSDDEVNVLDCSVTALYSWLSQYLPGYASLLPWLSLRSCKQVIEASTFIQRDVPGRKWQQITAFVGAASGTASAATPKALVDWCAGKSHLGRVAAIHYNASLCALERDPVLCQEGETLAHQQGVDATFVCMDVLQQPYTMHPQDHVFALHACGDLHRQLVKCFVDNAAARLVLAPCCYDKWLSAGFAPLSTMARQHDLKLTKTQVRLAMQEAVTAPARDQAMMHQLKILRLAFDRWQREARDHDEYLPTPSLPLSAAKWDHKRFFTTLAEKKGLPLKIPQDVSAYVEQARTQYAMVRRLQLAGHGFRRAIELWLVCDIALVLQEAGYRVDMHEFCARELTPRNIQLIASR